MQDWLLSGNLWYFTAAYIQEVDDPYMCHVYYVHRKGCPCKVIALSRQAIQPA